MVVVCVALAMAVFGCKMFVPGWHLEGSEVMRTLVNNLVT